MSKPRSIGEQIISLREEGLTYKQIAEELDCSKGTIAYHLGQGQKLKYADSSKKSRTRRYERYYALKNNPCVDCGKIYPVTMMHFDHLGIEKKDNQLSSMICNNSWEDILKEIDKCELVCIVCHGLRTISRSIDVGTATPMLIESYNKYMATECGAEAAR